MCIRDRYHSAANIEKLESGVPLSDADRAPWLQSLCGLLHSVSGKGEQAVLACSALKVSYRRYLAGCASCVLVYLKGDAELIRSRLAARPGHFMNPGLIESQLETLEEPEDEALVVDVRATPEEIVAAIRRQLRL
jgi:gluconokinase